MTVSAELLVVVILCFLAIQAVTGMLLYWLVTRAVMKMVSDRADAFFSNTLGDSINNTIKRSVSYAVAEQLDGLHQQLQAVNMLIGQVGEMQINLIKATTEITRVSAQLGTMGHGHGSNKPLS
jgi:hypothetical protein